MLQLDDILHNYTAAKATCDCDFDLNSTKYDCYEKDGVCYAFIGCSHHCS